jgi:hypothetical protein
MALTVGAALQVHGSKALLEVLELFEPDLLEGKDVKLREVLESV